VALSDTPGLAAAAEREKADLVVIGPDGAIADGLGDRLREKGIPAFGPGAAAGRIESSKSFAKNLMKRESVPTARFGVFKDAAKAASFARELGSCAVKADGLALGKGVVVCDDPAQAEAAIHGMMVEGRFGESGRTLVIEEKLEGPEVSVFAVTDGRRSLLLAPAQDHKRLLDGDRGPNTGGMGAYAPAPFLDAAGLDEVRGRIIEPVLRGLALDGTPFIGVLYAGLMLTSAGPRVIEFNARFGDPEAQVILPLLEGDTADLFLRAARGDLSGASVKVRPGARCCVVLAARGYPEKPEKGLPVSLEGARCLEGVEVLHAGTALKDGRLVSSGGRVLNVVGSGPDLRAAVARAYAGVEAVRFEGAIWRKDIARRVLE
jgi:phosphoribosylamine--glycine ligase